MLCSSYKYIRNVNTILFNSYDKNTGGTRTVLIDNRMRTNKFLTYQKKENIEFKK